MIKNRIALLSGTRSLGFGPIVKIAGGSISFVASVDSPGEVFAVIEFYGAKTPAFTDAQLLGRLNLRGNNQTDKETATIQTELEYIAAKVVARNGAVSAAVELGETATGSGAPVTRIKPGTMNQLQFLSNDQWLDVGGAGGLVSVAGTPAVGQTLTALLAAGYSATGYQWTRANADGSNVVNIAGATSQTYTVQAADKDKLLGCSVTGLAAIAGGVRVPADVATPPVLVTAPSVNGTPTVGAASSYTPGVWTGADNVTAKWQVAAAADGVGAVEVGSAATYTPQAGDAGKYLGIMETANSAAGPTTAKSTVWKAVQATLGQLRVVSSGLRLPIASQTAQPNRHHVSRLKRRALVNISGVVRIIVPTFTMKRPTVPTVQMNEALWTDAFKIQVAIEPNYLQAATGHAASPKIVSASATYDPAVNLPQAGYNGYLELVVDLGATVIPKGQDFGIWCAIENLNSGLGSWEMPFGNVANSKVAGQTLYELSFSRTDAQGGSFIDTNYISTVDSITARNINQDCFSPVALLAMTTSDAWAIAGDSIPEGVYDTDIDLRGDTLGNKGYAEKYVGTRLQLPCLNLSKGSDRLSFVNNTDTNATPNRPAWQFRRAILKRCNVTHFHTNLGINDFASRTPAQMIADAIVIDGWVRADTPGIKTYHSTITPSSTSTDNWATTANQTASTASGAGSASKRGQFIAAVRGKTGGLTWNGYFELANIVENDPVNFDSKWKLANRTSDGIHPNYAASDELANGVVLVNYP